VTLRRKAAIAVVALALLLVAHEVVESKPPPLEGPVRVDVSVFPIPAFNPRDPARRQFGPLTFRGGFEMQAKVPQFGGLSGLLVSADGTRLTALTDAGEWLTGTLRYDGSTPAGLADVEMRPVIGPSGRPLTATGDEDTESLTADGSMLYVGVERDNIVLRFDTAREGLAARGQPVPTPDAIRRLGFNRGLEALAFAPAGHRLAGTLVAVAERDRDASAPTIPGFLIGGPAPGTFSVTRSDEFDVTDAAFLPDGDLLLLERYFSPLRGVAMRLRRFAAADLVPGAVLTGRILITADMGYQVDNMEGLAVHRDPSNGDTVLTLVSDDNFSIMQRTILLQFTYREPAP
jgi:hypothetical protein